MCGRTGPSEAVCILHGLIAGVGGRVELFQGKGVEDG